MRGGVGEMLTMADEGGADIICEQPLIEASGRQHNSALVLRSNTSTDFVVFTGWNSGPA